MIKVEPKPAPDSETAPGALDTASYQKLIATLDATLRYLEEEYQPGEEIPGRHVPLISAAMSPKGVDSAVESLDLPGIDHSVNAIERCMIELKESNDCDQSFPGSSCRRGYVSKEMRPLLAVAEALMRARASGAQENAATEAELNLEDIVMTGKVPPMSAVEFEGRKNNFSHRPELLINEVFEDPENFEVKELYTSSEADDKHFEVTYKGELAFLFRQGALPGVFDEHAWTTSGPYDAKPEVLAKCNFKPW